MEYPNLLNMRFRFCFLWLGILLLAAFGGSGVSAQSVLISEFVAVNEGSLTDSEGDDPDWIELQNTGSSTVDLTGWHLTDDAGGVEDLGPIFRTVTDSAPAQNLPVDTEIVVTAKIEEAAGPVTNITLYHRQVFTSETAVAMRDDGNAPDTTPGDDIYSATVPLVGLANGEMIRWRIEAEDTTGKTSHAPLFHDPLNSPEYYGTIANDPSITSQLPTIQWFVENESASDTVHHLDPQGFYKIDVHVK